MLRNFRSFVRPLHCAHSCDSRCRLSFDISPISPVMDVSGIKDSFCHVEILEGNARAVEGGDLVVVLPASGGSRQHRADGGEERAGLSVLELAHVGGLVRAWALDGFGIVERSEWSVFQDLRDGQLIRVLPDWSLPDADIVALPDPRAVRAVRVDAFVDRLAAEIMSGT